MFAPGGGGPNPRIFGGGIVGELVLMLLKELTPATPVASDVKVPNLNADTMDTTAVPFLMSFTCAFVRLKKTANIPNPELLNDQLTLKSCDCNLET